MLKLLISCKLTAPQQVALHEQRAIGHRSHNACDRQTSAKRSNNLVQCGMDLNANAYLLTLYVQNTKNN